MILKLIIHVSLNQLLMCFFHYYLSIIRIIAKNVEWRTGILIRALCSMDSLQDEKNSIHGQVL